MTFLRKDDTFSQDLSEDALSYTTSIGRARRITRIVFHASQAITETITITLDSGAGVNYDTVLKKIPFVAEADAVYEPPGGIDLQSGDELKIECTNANGVGTIRGYVKSKELQDS